MSSHVEHDPVGTQVTSENVSFEWRRARYEEMGFNESESVALANSKQTEYTGGKDKNSKRLEWTVPLSWAKVQTALDNGCSQALALEIFVTVE